MPGTVLGSGDPMVTEINCFLNASNLGIHFFKGKEIKEVIRAGGGEHSRRRDSQCKGPEVGPGGD